MADIFISYKKEDRKVTEALAAALEAEGLSVWWDDALNPKGAWDTIIEREIAAAGKVLVLWSPRAVKSDWVRTEAHYAQDHNKLVPIVIEECTLPLAFMLRQAVDLSNHKFDKANPEWRRLLEWIAEDGSEAPSDTDASPAAASQAPRAANEGWLGPKKRPAMAFGVAGLIAIGAAGFSFMGGGKAFGDLPQPDVVVDTFDVRSDALPASFADSLADEMSTDFSTSSRISPKAGDGTRVADAYQLGGNIETDDEKVRLFTRIFAPGIETPILTTRIETDIEYIDDAAQILGSQVARLTRCIATASDSTGSDIVRLPEAAIKPWAKFCQQSTVDYAALQARLATLQDVVEAAPDFANGWANLAELTYWSAALPTTDGEETIAKAAEAADRALAIDETSAKAIATKAMMAMRMIGDVDGDKRRAPFGDLEEWDRLAQRSIEVRQSDCGCEGPQYAAGLQAIGLPSQAVVHVREAVDADPRNLTHIRDYAMILSDMGRYDAALSALDMAEEAMPTAQLDGYRYAFALSNGKMDDALKFYRQSLDGEPEDPEFVRLLGAYASKDRARIEKEAARIAEKADQPTGTTHLFLALAGDEEAAMTAIDAMYDQRGPSVFRSLWSPALAEVRKTDAFAKLVREAGLVDYWAKSGRSPDMCRARGANAQFCSAI